MRGEGIETAFIDPGKPWQNGSNESFNGGFRDECISVEWFRNRTEAIAVIDSCLGYLPPSEFKKRYLNSRPTRSGSTSQELVAH
jgi:putative transposase